MDALAVLVSLTLPWWLGTAALMTLRPASARTEAHGGMAWTIGAGYLAGAFMTTVWMRAISLAGLQFSLPAVAGPVASAAILCSIVVWRRARAARGATPSQLLAHALRVPDLAPALRLFWWLILAWLALRFALLGIEVATRPLYPWDAWTQWATKARVWYELGRIAPFARIDAWLAANGGVYFDASPEYPPTMPLLQAWTCLCVGRWDDTLMNAPWWAIGITLPLVIYGGLRAWSIEAFTALIGALLVASLPLANTHVALAGYADLPMAAWYSAAVLAFLNWARTRATADAVVALLFAVACTQIKNPGWFWAATLLPGAVVVLWPKHGVRTVLTAFIVGAFALAALARFNFALFGYQVKLDYTPAWGDLLQSYFLLGNWHLLWYGAIAAALLAWRQLFTRLLAPLTTVVLAGLLFLFFVFGFTTASYYISDQTTVNRATLHIAPVAVFFMVVAWQAFARQWTGATPDSASPKAG